MFTRSQAEAFLAECRAAMEALVSEERSEFGDAEQADFDTLAGWVAETQRHLERLDQIERIPVEHPERAIPTGVAPQVIRDNGDPFDLRTLPMTAGRNELRGRALKAIEHVSNLADSEREAATRLVERHETPSGALSRHLLATGAETYRSGWVKLVSGNGHLMSDQERHAVDSARALSLSDAAGGYAVPFTLDPTIISTKDVSTNPFRRVSRVVTTVTDQWQGVTSGGMTVSWDGEAAEVSDDSPTLGNAPIPVHKAQGFAIGSIEITQDWASIEADLRSMIGEGKDDAEAVVFATGTGTNQPTGITTALDGTSSEVAPTTAETFAVADLYKVINALPAKYRLARMDGDAQESNACWMAEVSTYNKARQFDTNGGAALWEYLGGGRPGKLLGYGAYEASAMDAYSDLDAAVTADNFLMVLGDFRNYVIVDRVGLSVEFVPHIFGTAHNRPTGQRGWYCYWRVGADSVNDAAFRMLSIPTTA